MNLKDEFEKYLIKTLPKVESFHPHFQDALHYMLSAGGKRFRPLLLLTVVNSYCPLLLKNSMPIAAAIEYLHTYSLIHDDLPAMDNANLRRGLETLHKKFDETTAILIGDALNTHSFYLIANSSLSNDIKVEIVKELSLNGGIYGMVLGQAYDCHFENTLLDLEKLKNTHIYKTAKLIAASLKIGAIIVDLDKNKKDDLYRFGIDLGLLFQIQDDLIDALAKEKEVGKTTKNDAKKNSFVNLLGIDKTIKEADALSDSIGKNIKNFDKNLSSALKNLLDEYLNRHKNFIKR